MCSVIDCKVIIFYKLYWVLDKCFKLINSAKESGIESKVNDADKKITNTNGLVKNNRL